ncbi:alcohol dehydrogenase superfamily, zinc-type [Artemisia annua]|uniref:Probable quinone oxidoreductase n=1 Tax=Artemisia annua TaxID=35608 RepID=A0A2U1NDI5_ARTAN|nr:alcohol dehydrogenase superfamily, zinc-type [Artemisia annua]
MAVMKEDMDTRSSMCLLSNGFKRSSDDSKIYYWKYAPVMFIYLFLYIDYMGFTCESKAEIWVTKGLLDEEKENIMGMKIFRTQSGNTLRVSNGMLVQILLGGHSTLSLEGSLSGNHDEEKKSKGSCIYAVGSHKYQVVYTRPDIASADVGMLDRFDRGLQMDVHALVDSDYVMGRSITMYGFMIQECVAMKWEDIELGELKSGEIKLKAIAIGVNFLDVYMRKGLIEYGAPPLPFTPGMEAAGTVIAIGPGVTTCSIGDIVAYAGFPVCAYSEELIIPAERAVPVPPSVDPIVAASVLFKGLIAEVLVGPGHTILVHAAAGGVGSLLCQWGNALGATVIGTVSTKAKAVQAKEDGCHHVIIYKEEDFVDRVNEITSGKGIDVAYDSIGKLTVERSLSLLKPRGYMVSYGMPSGEPDPIKFQKLAMNSVFYTIPSMMLYTEARDELLAASEELFTNVAKGVLRVRVNHRYPLSQVAQAHSDLESQKTTGSIVLIP